MNISSFDVFFSVQMRDATRWQCLHFLKQQYVVWLVKNIIYTHYIECEIECDLVWATNDFFNQPDYKLLFKKMTTLPPCGIPHLDRKKYIKT